MKIHSESLIPHARDAVYETYRDRLPEVATFLPDVESITVMSRSDEEGRTVLHNVWFSNTDIPKAAQGFLKPEHLQWDDHAIWTHSAYQVAWRIETRVFSESFQCQGTNTFHAEGDGTTRVVVAGDLHIDLSNMPGVPRFIAKRLAPQVEAFIVKMIAPNLKQVNEAVGRYISEGQS